MPRNEASRFDLFESSEEANSFREAGAVGYLPVWREEDLSPHIAGDEVRARFSAELVALPLAIYEEILPVPEIWPDAHCGYLKFSTSYEKSVERAKNLDWEYRELKGSHF